MKYAVLVAFLSVMCAATQGFAHDSANWSDNADPATSSTMERDSNFTLTMGTEFGLISVMKNKLQQGSDGTYFDFVEDGGQELFTPFLRLSSELKFNKRHTVIFLYQPINLETRVRFGEEVTVDEITFPEGKMMDLRYGFDFFRLNYMYDVAPSDDLEVSLGGGFQMRIATTNFTPIDGSEGRTSRDLGPVPLLKLRVRKELTNDWFVSTEIDGFYANITVLNGDTESDVEGAIYDASLRAGKALGPGLEGFLNLRLLGGGAEGTSPEDARQNPGDGYTKNWLVASTISLGFYFEPSVLTR